MKAGGRSVHSTRHSHTTTKSPRDCGELAINSETNAGPPIIIMSRRAAFQTGLGHAFGVDRAQRNVRESQARLVAWGGGRRRGKVTPLSESWPALLQGGSPQQRSQNFLAPLLLSSSRPEPSAAKARDSREEGKKLQRCGSPDKQFKARKAKQRCRKVRREGRALCLRQFAHSQPSGA